MPCTAGRSNFSPLISPAQLLPACGESVEATSGTLIDVIDNDGSKYSSDPGMTPLRNGVARPTLVYFGYAPAEGAGSAIIVLRHLRRFAANGWNVRVVADWGQDHAYCRDAQWPVMELSHRRPWWPPFNAEHALSRWIRTWLWAGEVRDWLGPERPTAVLTYLSAFSDMLSMAAAGFANRFRCPLATIVHDDSRCFAATEENATRAHAGRQWILRNSTQAWFASPGLASCFSLNQAKVGVLPPIPDGYRAGPEWKPEFAASPLLVYAGNYWPGQIPMLAKLGRQVAAAGGRLLLLVKPSPDIERLCRDEPILWREPFRENREALSFLSENAAALLVSYSETSDAMPWVRTSFPSKLIEYTHLGLPILICAPADTAVAIWAKERAFPNFALPDEAGSIGRFIEGLKDAESWRKMGAISHQFAETEFDPAQIQSALETGLLEHATHYA